jgi:glycosyltransferase involved in cell wall biosynthesis
MKNILIVVNSLDMGGSEKFLLRLIQNMPEKQFIYKLYPLKFHGLLIDSFKKLPIDVIDTRNYSIIKHIFELKKLMITSSIVFSFLYKSDLIVIITKLLFILKTPIVWNIRNSQTSFFGNKFLTFLNIKFNSFFSSFADAITYNSEAAFLSHKKIGFKFNKHYFLPNGFLLNLQKTNLIKTNSQTIIIGSLSRLDYQKNHKFLLRSFSNFLKNSTHDIYLFLVGRNVLSRKVTNLISKFGLDGRVIRLDQVTDTSLFFDLIDIYVSTSRSESFSNSIAEAVFMDKKILVSNVGDNIKYFSPLSVFENFNSKDFEFKLNNLLTNIDESLDYSKFKHLFSISNTTNVFLHIVEEMMNKNFPNIIK